MKLILLEYLSTNERLFSLYRVSRLIYKTSFMLWGEDSLPYSIYHDTRGEAFAIVNYIISVYEA